MKTSVIEVQDMLSVLTVDDVEGRFGRIPGINSATVNHAEGNVTVRYDETRLEVADIEVLVHQRGPQPTSESLPVAQSGHEPARKPDAVPTPKGTPASASKPEAAAPVWYRAWRKVRSMAVVVVACCVTAPSAFLLSTSRTLHYSPAQ